MVHGAENIGHGGEGGIRVLHIGKFYPPYAGGIENYFRDILHGLQEQDVAVAALVHHHQAAKPTRREVDEGIRITRAFSWGQLLYAPLSPTLPLILGRTIKDFQPHILHFHLPNTSAFWALFMPGARAVPWVVHWHSDVVPSRIDRRLAFAYRFYRPVEKAFLRRSRKIIATSQAYLEHSRPLKKWSKKCAVAELGVDPQRLPWPEPNLIAAAANTWPPGKLKVLAVGRLTYYKGFDVLIRAAGLVKGVAVEIVGGGDRRAKLEREIAARGLAERIVLRGALSDRELQALMATCDCLCLPSLERTEAFGVVLLEAMRYGKALVAGDIPGSGVGWVLRQSDCGLLVPPGDAEALAESLRTLLSRPDLRRDLGKRGKRAFERIFHIRPAARKIKEIYTQLLS